MLTPDSLPKDLRKWVDDSIQSNEYSSFLDIVVEAIYKLKQDNDDRKITSNALNKVLKAMEKHYGLYDDNYNIKS